MKWLGHRTTRGHFESRIYTEGKHIMQFDDSDGITSNTLNTSRT